MHLSDCSVWGSPCGGLVDQVVKELRDAAFRLAVVEAFSGRPPTRREKGRRPPEGAQHREAGAETGGGNAVMTMLADDHALESVVYRDRGILASLPKGAIHISSSTISVALSERLAVDHAAAGQRFIAAPVFGRPEIAATNRLFV